MMPTAHGHRARPLRAALATDAIFEFVCAALLIGAAGKLGDWLAIGTTATTVLGLVFAAAGLAICALLRVDHGQLVRGLALANIIGGCIGWVVLLAAWSLFEPAGRAVLGSASDGFILVGALELLALRRGGGRLGQAR